MQGLTELGKQIEIQQTLSFELDDKSHNNMKQAEHIESQPTP